MWQNYFQFSLFSQHVIKEFKNLGLFIRLLETDWDEWKHFRKWTEERCASVLYKYRAQQQQHSFKYFIASLPEMKKVGVGRKRDRVNKRRRMMGLKGLR